MKPRSPEELQRFLAEKRFESSQRQLEEPLPDKYFNGVFREFTSERGMHVRWLCKDIDDKINPGYALTLSAATRKIIRSQDFKHGEEEQAKKAYDEMVAEALKNDTLVPLKKNY